MVLWPQVVITGQRHSDIFTNILSKIDIVEKYDHLFSSGKLDEKFDHTCACVGKMKLPLVSLA